ncbi:MAG: hypothetical protein WEB53_02580 [Akkermansiaceae bacterium]
MKALLFAVISVLLLNSCGFEQPFGAEAKLPVESNWLGVWDQVPDKSNEAAHRMLVIQHSANQCIVQYPVGGNAMFFRARAISWARADFVQIQLIGTAKAPAKPEDRKYHLLKIGLTSETLEIRTINPDLLGKNLKDSTAMKVAFTDHQEDPELFACPIIFRRPK